jgi:tetratricopeptide (TPR) repeat protein
LYVGDDSGQISLSFTVILLGSGLQSVGRETQPLTDQEKDALRDASIDLEKATGESRDPVFDLVYGSLLAHCYYETGHLHDAAAQYERFLAWKPLPILPGWKLKLYKLLSTIYQNTGQIEAAVECLERCGAEFPEEAGIHRKLAELFADRGDYRSAYECLVKEKEVTPELEKELGVRIALALGALQGSTEPSDQASKFLESHPPIRPLLDSTLKAYWPRFIQLREQSQSEWRSGICEMYLFASMVPEDRIRRNENAVKHFAKVVELELKTRVFEEYRKQVPGQNRNPSLPTPGRDPWLRTLDYFLAKRGKLNLDKMIQTFQGMIQTFQGKYSSDPVAQRFHAWLQEKHRKLLLKIEVLEKIRRPRGDATHEEMTPKLAESVAQWCREVLDSFVPSPS